MSVCLVSQQPTARLLRLKELIGQAIDQNVYYMLLPEYIEVDLSKFDHIILCAPFNGQVRKCVLDNKGSAKLIVDIDPQHAFTPFIDNGTPLVSQNLQAFNHVSNSDSHRVIQGLVDISLYKNSQEVRQSNLVVDLNYITKNDLDRVKSSFSINTFSMGTVTNLTEFQGLCFNRALLAQELDDLTILSDCQYALYTTAPMNEEIIIPDTMIDCLLMNIPVFVTNNLTMAKQFVLDYNCGYVISRDNLVNLKDLISQLRPVQSIYDTFSFGSEISTVKELLQ